MNKTLRNILGIGSVAAASILPAGLKAQSSVPADSAGAAEVRGTSTNFSIASDLANKSRFWGIPFLATPHYKEIIGATRGNLSGSVTGNINVNEHRLFDVDVDVNYSLPLSRKLSSFLGYTYFSFDLGEGWDWASAAYASLSANVPLNPSLTYNHLFRFGGGDYIEGAVSGKVPFSQTSLNLTGKLGYNLNALRQGEGFTHLEAVAAIPVRLSEKVTITPRLDYFHSISPDAPTVLIGGVNLEIKLHK